MIRLSRVPLLFGAFLSLLPLATSAQTVTFTVPMDGTQEVPQVMPAGTGTATLTLNVSTRLVSISGSYTGLTSNQQGAHLHGPAARGANSGNILIILTGTGGTSGTFSGSATLSVANVNNLLNNLTYVNIHSDNNPGGEIRGQVEFAGSSVECNGTAVNPVILTNTSSTAPAPAPPMDSPVIGKNLRLTLDCSSGTIGGTAIFRVGFGPKPAPMLSKWGEILVPITAGTGQNFFATVSGTGTADMGPIPLPFSGAFVGATYTVQGFCPGSPDGFLSNARAETIGTL